MGSKQRRKRRKTGKNIKVVKAPARVETRCDASTPKFRVICFGLPPRYRFLSVRGAIPSLKRVFRNVPAFPNSSVVIGTRRLIAKNTKSKTKKKWPETRLTESDGFSNCALSKQLATNEPSDHGNYSRLCDSAFQRLSDKVGPSIEKQNTTIRVCRKLRSVSLPPSAICRKLRPIGPCSPTKTQFWLLHRYKLLP